MTSTSTRVYKLIEVPLQLIFNLFFYLHNVYINGALSSFFFHHGMLMKARKDTFLNILTDPPLQKNEKRPKYIGTFRIYLGDFRIYLHIDHSKSVQCLLWGVKSFTDS